MTNPSIIMENGEEKTVDDIKKEIKTLENDIEKIQEDCAHKEYDVKFMQDTKSVRRICKLCDKDLGYANQAELEENGYRK